LPNLNVKPPMHERKAPPHKRKAPLMTTFWRRFCYLLHNCLHIIYSVQLHCFIL